MATKKRPTAPTATTSSKKTSSSSSSSSSSTGTTIFDGLSVKDIQEHSKSKDTKYKYTGHYNRFLSWLTIHHPTTTKAPTPNNPWSGIDWITLLWTSVFFHYLTFVTTCAKTGKRFEIGVAESFWAMYTLGCAQCNVTRPLEIINEWKLFLIGYKNLKALAAEQSPDGVSKGKEPLTR